MPRRAVSIESDPIGSSFKREFGMPPAGWRKNRSKGDVAGAPANAMQAAGETTATA